MTQRADVPIVIAFSTSGGPVFDRLTPGWTLVHIGLEGDDVEIHGVNPWRVKWVPRLFQITVAHPSYPAQRHTMWTYEISGPEGPLVFAAGEFSNGVWGFYEPT